MPENEFPTPDVLRLSEGKYDLVVRSVSRDAEEGDFGWTYRVAVVVDGEERTVRASESLYAAFHPHLKAGKRSFVLFVKGSGRDRRYFVEAVA